jgi:uncharacterized protein (TIGR00299 family) protein
VILPESSPVRKVSFIFLLILGRRIELARILFFDCFAGISGDMTLSALLDLGLPEEKLRNELGKLPLGDYSLEIVKGEKSGIGATGLHILPGDQGQEHRHFSHIREMIESSLLEEGAKDISLRIFRVLAQAEATVHGQLMEDVHFHEVGAVDSIVDIVGTAVGIEYFKPDRILTSKLPMGSGFVECRHGRLPLPVPAVLEILKEYPLQGVPLEEELVTPTGAAIVKALSSGVTKFPGMKMSGVGYGMGKRNLPDRPNLLRLLWGEAEDGIISGRAVILEANFDDTNPQFHGYLLERLLEKGAGDVSFIPLYKEGNRLGTLLRAIVQEKDADGLADWVLRESTAWEVHLQIVEKKMAAARRLEVDTSYGRVRVKEWKGIKFHPEYEDCRRLALEKKVPIQVVYREVLRNAK